MLLRSRRARLATVLMAIPLVFSVSWIGPTFADDPPRKAPAETLVQLSTDPFTDAGSQHRTEVEPDNFAFGSTVVSAFQVGRFFNGGASNIGFATSLDAGAHWTNGFLPASTKVATPPGKYDRASDPSVAFDAKHNVWLISWLGLLTPNPNNAGSFKVDVLVSRSTDGGLTWSAPVGVDATGTKFLDKNWTVCDNTPSSPFFGNCYTEYDDNGRNDLVLMSTSSDGGLTWGPGKTTSDPPNAFSIPRNTPGAHGLGGQPLVQPNGRVVVPYVNLDVELTFFAFGAGSFVSTDGGNTWSTTVLISEQDFHEPNAACPQLAGCGIRADIPLPTAEIDAAGRVYVVWSDCRFQPMCQTSDLVLSTSDDGLVWSAVQRIPISAVGSLEDHFIPGLAVDRTTSGRGAHLALAYYFYPDANCTTDTCDLNVGFISSTNGGRSWSTPEQLAGPMKLRWLPNTTQGFMVGDYISTAIPTAGGRSSGRDDGRDGQEASNPVPVFAVARPPSGGLLDEAIFTVVGERLDRGGNVPIEGAEGRGSGRDISSMGSRSDETQPLPLRQHKTIQ